MVLCAHTAEISIKAFTLECGEPVSIHRLERPAVSLTFSDGSDCAMETRWDRVIAVQCNQSLNQERMGINTRPST